MSATYQRYVSVLTCMIDSGRAWRVWSSSETRAISDQMDRIGACHRIGHPNKTFCAERRAYVRTDDHSGRLRCGAKLRLTSRESNYHGLQEGRHKKSRSASASPSACLSEVALHAGSEHLCGIPSISRPLIPQSVRSQSQASGLARHLPQ